MKVLTESSEREEVTIVRLSPKAFQRAVEETFKRNIQVKIIFVYCLNDILFSFHIVKVSK